MERNQWRQQRIKIDGIVKITFVVRTASERLSILRQGTRQEQCCVSNAAMIAGSDAGSADTKSKGYESVSKGRSKKAIVSLVLGIFSPISGVITRFRRSSLVSFGF